MPVRANGNLLLCTLLLGNVAVNAMLSIIMADKAGGTAGFLISTFVIVIFGYACVQECLYVYVPKCARARACVCVCTRT